MFIAVVFSSCTALKAPRERYVKITIMPFFKLNSIGESIHYYTLEYKSGDTGESVVWPDSAPKPKELHMDQKYTVELLEHQDKLYGPKSPSTNSQELVIFRQGTRILYDASICKIHGDQMARKVVPIGYGLPAFNSPYWKSMGKDFPNHGVALGGCCFDLRRDPRFTRVWVCPTCLAKHKDWKTHQKEPATSQSGWTLDDLEQIIKKRNRSHEVAGSKAAG